MAQQRYNYPFTVLKPPWLYGLTLTSWSSSSQMCDINVVAVVHRSGPFPSYFFRVLILLLYGGKLQVSILTEVALQSIKRLS